MKLCRFIDPSGQARLGRVSDGVWVQDLGDASGGPLTRILEAPSPTEALEALAARESARLPLHRLSTVRLLPPVERQEVWAAGVTYLRSKKARMEESSFSATAYDRVYEAERPELFFKALPEKVVGPGAAVGIRRDARWSVPEPELVLVLNHAGSLVGFTIGNDMSSRDIEGENLLYLPQAKIYSGSCAIGPWIVVGADESAARQWAIRLVIARQGRTVFEGETSAAQIKRGFGELAAFLTRCQEFPQGAMLLTGTGIVPPDTFTLAPGDQVSITISGIGTLQNPVAEV